LFGVAPAWQATRVDLNTALKSGAGAAGGGRFPLRRVLMVVQAALSMVLLVGAGLFVRTLHNLRSVDAGFARENLILFSVDPSQNGYRGAEMVRFHQRLLERLRQLPGAQSVALTRFPLLGGGGNSRRVGPEGLDPAPNQNLGTGVNVVSPDYFETLQIRLRLGRAFTERDEAAAPRVAIVNEAFARAFLRGENPVGRSFVFTQGPNADRRSPPMEIVGLISDVRYLNLRDAVRPAVYLPFAQEPGIGGASFLIRARDDAAALAPALRTALREIDPNVPLTGLRTQDEQVDRLLANERLFAQLTTFLGAVALVLTCIGLYGLLAHQVTARTREIGIRMALGAQLRAVVLLVLREGLGLAVLGVVIGLGVALGVTRFVAKMLFGVQPLDPTTLAGAGLVLVVIAALACWLPARRAGKVDPMTALRAE
jgi:predicted permease